MPTIVGKRYPDELAQIDAVARKRRDAESEEAQRTERKLLAEIAAEDKKRAEAVNLPPESPAERRERELEERIANLEHRQIEPGPVSFDVQSESRQHRRREALRLLRNRKDLEEREQRERGDGLSAAVRHGTGSRRESLPSATTPSNPSVIATSRPIGRFTNERRTRSTSSGISHKPNTRRQRWQRQHPSRKHLREHRDRQRQQ